MNNIINFITKNPRCETIFRAGDFVTVKDYGEGVLIGFNNESLSPIVYLYSRQECVCVGEDDLKRKC